MLTVAFHAQPAAKRLHVIARGKRVARRPWMALENDPRPEGAQVYGFQKRNIFCGLKPALDQWVPAHKVTE
jgi:hypothetical protein